jgi:hypothetical protein
MTEKEQIRKEAAELSRIAHVRCAYRECIKVIDSMKDGGSNAEHDSLLDDVIDEIRRRLLNE